MTSEECISVKEYFERVLAEADKRYEQRFVAQERAIEVAAKAVDGSRATTKWAIGLAIGAFVSVVIVLLKGVV